MGERDKPHSYRHEPLAQGLPLIMETVEKSSEKMETTPAAPGQSFPPQICSSRSMFRGFCVSAALPPERHQETIFIGVFRSRRSFWKKDRRHRSHEGQVDGSHAAKESGSVGPPLLAFRFPLFRFLCSYALFLPKTDARKFSGHLDVVLVPET